MCRSRDIQERPLKHPGSRAAHPAAESGLTVKPEGNAHQAEFSENQDFIVAADEDFTPYSVVARNTTKGTEFEATQGSDTPQIDVDTSIEGQTKFVGRACNGDPAVPAGDGTQIAVVERGVCTFTEKVAAVEAAGGYVGIIIFNREGSDACSDLLNMDVQGNLPTLFVWRDTGFGFFNEPYYEATCRSGSSQSQIPVGKTGDSVSVEAVFDGWGYVHIFENGVGKLNEVGSFIDQGGNNFWGVQVWHKNGKEYVLASDRDYSLYIFEYTGSE